MSIQIPPTFIAPAFKFKNLEQLMGIVKSLKQLMDIAQKMHDASLSEGFVIAAIELAIRYEGIRDLMIMWSQETDSDLKDEIIADIQAEIDEESEILMPAKLQKSDYLHFDDLEAIAKDVMKFKKQLKIEIERWGGISKLAQETDIPQASLSRFFNFSLHASSIHFSQNS